MRYVCFYAIVFVFFSAFVRAQECAICDTQQAVQTLVLKEISAALAESDLAKYRQLTTYLERISFEEGLTGSELQIASSSASPGTQLSEDNETATGRVRVVDIGLAAAAVTTEPTQVDGAGANSAPSVEANGAGASEEDSPTVLDSDIDQSRFFFTLGATSLSPYLIREVTEEEKQGFPTWPPEGLDDVLAPGRGADYVLEENEGVSGYFEIGYRNRWAWRRPSSEDAETCGISAYRAGEDGDRISLRRWSSLAHVIRCIDKDIRLGFAFGEDDPSASSLLGSGDIALSIQLGLPIFTYSTNGEGGVPIARHSFNIEYLNEISTSREFQDINDRRSWGVSYNLGMLGPTILLGDVAEENRNRVYELSVQYMRGTVDGPRIIETPGLGAVEIDGSNRRLVVSENGSPVFQSFDDTYHYGIDLQVPYGNRGYISLGGAFVTGSVDPNPWAVQIGFTLPSSDILKILSP